jgi:hypothetical protein
MLVHFHPTFALLIVLAFALAAFSLLPYLGGNASSTGVWFISAIGRRSAVAGAVASGLITPLAVILDEAVVDFAGWMPGWPPEISNGLIPAALFIGLLAGVTIAIKKAFRAPRPETVQALVVFLVVMFVMLTIICAIFRGESMALRWPGI